MCNTNSNTPIQLLTISNKIIRCGISHAFHNKELQDSSIVDPKSMSFKETSIQLEGLIQHITSGKAFSPPIFKNNHRKGTKFIQAQLLGLDFDEDASVQDCQEHDFIGQYACFIGATSGSGKPNKQGIIRDKTRVIFLLDQPITNARKFKQSVEAVYTRCLDLKPDYRCLDVPRMFYGSDNPDFVVLDNSLPLSVLDDLIAAQESKQPKQSRKVTKRAKHPRRLSIFRRKSIDVIPRHKKYAQATLTNLAGQLARTPEGERNDKLYKWGRKMGKYAGAGMIKYDEVEKQLHHAALVSGLPEDEIMQTLPHAIRDGMKTPFDVSLLDRETSLLPVDLATPDHTINQDYIRLIEDITIGVTFIKSAMGTGKTEFVKDWIKHLEKIMGRVVKVCAITHNCNLISMTAQRWQGFVDYQSIHKDEYRQQDKIIITPNSIHHLLNKLGELPKYDVVIIDEPYHVLSAINSSMFDKNSAQNSLTIILEAIKRSTYALLMDAYLTNNVVSDFTANLDKTVTVFDNSYRADKGQAIFHSNEGFCLQSAIDDAIKYKALLVVACETVTQCDAVAAILGKIFGSKNVLSVNANHSDEKVTFDLTDDFNAYASKYKAIVHTTAISSGVSITIEAVSCGLFEGSTHGKSAGLTANDYAQMIGRTRKKKACHMWVKPVKSERKTDPEVIQRELCEEIIENPNAMTIKAHPEEGVFQPENPELLSMYARIQANKNTQINNSIGYAVAYLKYDGYSIERVDDKDEAMTKRLDDMKAELKEQQKELVLNPKTPIISDAELTAMRMRKEAATPVILAGNLKYKICRFVGDIEITEQHYDDLHKLQDRDAIIRLANIYTDDEILQKQDKEDSYKQAQHRKNRLLNKRFDEQFLLHLFDTCILDDLHDVNLTTGELGRRINAFIDYATKDKQLKSLIDAEIHKKKATVAKNLLSNLGIDREYKQIREKGQKTYIYWLTSDKLTRLSHYVSTILQSYVESDW